MFILVISDDDYGNNEVKDLLFLFLYEYFWYDDIFFFCFLKIDVYLLVNDEFGMGCGKYFIIMYFLKCLLCFKCCL